MLSSTQELSAQMFLISEVPEDLYINNTKLDKK